MQIDNDKSEVCTMKNLILTLADLDTELKRPTPSSTRLEFLYRKLNTLQAHV